MVPASAPIPTMFPIIPTPWSASGINGAKQPEAKTASAAILMQKATRETIEFKRRIKLYQGVASWLARADDRRGEGWARQRRQLNIDEAPSAEPSGGFIEAVAAARGGPH